MRRPPTIPLARSILALLTLTSLLVQPDRALCIGLDGHLAVEAAAGPEADCCPSDGDESAPQPSVFTADSCGPCRDVSLPMWTLTRPVKDDVARDLMTASLAGSLRPAVPERRAAAAAFDSRQVPRHRSRLTIVIRC